MRPLTILTTLAILFILIFAGVLGTGSIIGSSGTLTELWVTDTARDTTGNHHAPTAKRIANETLIVVPVNVPGSAGDCTLYAFDRELNEQWRTGMPDEDCNIHAFGDPTIVDLEGNGTDEVVVATTEGVVRVHDARTGEETFRRDLAGWGYAKPLVTDFTSNKGRELVVADLSGGVFVFDTDGTRLWNRSLSSITAPIVIDDFDANGAPELVVGEGKNATLLGSDGSIAWQMPIGGSVTWLTTGQADDDEAVEIVVTTTKGHVVAVDGATGQRDWSQQFDDMAAVYAFGDGDGDGQAEVYAVAEDGKLRALDASDGAIEWTTTLTTEDIQMTPPPALGDLDGDGQPELVAVSQDGVVSIVDPASGDILDSYKREVPIWMRPTLADLDSDSVPEIMVIYGDGRVVGLSYETE